MNCCLVQIAVPDWETPHDLCRHRSFSNPGREVAASHCCAFAGRHPAHRRQIDTGADLGFRRNLRWRPVFAVASFSARQLRVRGHSSVAPPGAVYEALRRLPRRSRLRLRRPEPRAFTAATARSVHDANVEQSESGPKLLCLQEPHDVVHGSGGGLLKYGFLAKTGVRFQRRWSS